MDPRPALATCALALGACSSDYEPAHPALPASSEWSANEPRVATSRARPPGLPTDLLPRGRNVAMAATAHGLVAFDPASGDVFASVDTPYRVIDLSHDPWRDQWISAEYDDDSAHRVSVWRLRRTGTWKLDLERTIETGGYARVSPARSSIVVFEHEGLRQRWMVWDTQLPERGSSLQAPVPAGVVSRHDAIASWLTSFSVVDDGSGPKAMMHRVRVKGPESEPIATTHLPEWSGEYSALRAADAGPGAIALAQVRLGALQVGLISDAGQMLRAPIAIDTAGAEAAEDVVADPERALVFVALSGLGRLLEIDLDDGGVLDQRACASAPAGGSPWFSRWIAYDPSRARLFAGCDQQLLAWDVSATRKLEEVAGFSVAGARRPVALSASTCAPWR